MKPEDEARSPGGIYIGAGMGLSIPAGGLVMHVDKEGNPTRVELKMIHVALDVSPFWMTAALDHLESAEKAREEILAAREEPAETRLQGALTAAFLAGMQCVSSAAFAVDAFADAVQQRVTIPEAQRAAWKKNRTARHRIIAEVLKRAFRIGPKSFTNVTDFLRVLFTLRDMAVHPPAGNQQPAWYEDLGAATAPIFPAFSCQNARKAAHTALSILSQSPALARPKLARLVEDCKVIEVRIRPLVERWERRYGPLITQAPNSESAKA